MEVFFLGKRRVPGGSFVPCVGGFCCGPWLCCSPFLITLATFGVRLLAFLLLVLARGVVFLKEFVPVLAKVGRVNNLVEELFGFFLLLVRVRVGPVVSKVVCGAVGGVDHKRRLEQIRLGRKVRREGPYVL